jgi:predicted Mrr-cat superfamily restriction endonuclease
MNEKTNSAPIVANAKHAAANEGRAIILKEVKAKWGKFEEADLSALKNRDDLVSQVVAKYGLEKGNVQQDVDSLLKGRHL